MGDSDQGLQSDFSAAVDVDQHLYVRFIFKLIPLKAVSDEGHSGFHLWIESLLSVERV